MKYYSRLPQCISDDFSPEEESNIKLRSVGKAQSNIRAYVSTLIMPSALWPPGLEIESCVAGWQVQDPEGRTLFDSTLSAQMQDVALPEEQYGMYRICVKNSGTWTVHASVRRGPSIVDHLPIYISMRQF
jgi:hypothetical protein